MKFTAATVVAALAVAGTVQANTVSKPTGPQTPVEAPKYEGGYVPPSTEYALEQLNKIRAANGLKPVCINKSLQASAQAHADWMARTGQHKHAPDTFQRMERYGYPGNTLRAENIAVNQNGVSDYNCFGYGPRVADVNTSAAYTTNCAWYTSQGHKDNMLTRDFNQVGIAYAKGTWAGRESYFWVQVRKLSSFHSLLF
ncbi:hypothetical protein BCR44DRAFT_52268 [Catenaria anguillulae PL171]|uniref:SCP domain-containing protein n=1 Tax=Catenaria anguillulae PL171 TaxID=765915 RepID=A0A1Y2I602_9FUNG|nr:hypothetical protein BCR44DRAFT_52268 [Catenaria anguillulae PL171]